MSPGNQARGAHAVRCAIAVAWVAGLAAVPAGAAPPLPAGTLPVPAAQWVSGSAPGAATQVRSGNTLTIQQNANQVILNWDSFNIGPGGLVRFQQPSTGSAALNRIFDANPTLIQGQLVANGKVYLLNGNGILFDAGSQVNVGALVASSLNLSDGAFLKGFLNVSPSFSGTTGFVHVAPDATITTASGGQVFLFAPNVENRGHIATPDGQTVLAAGQNLYLATSSDPLLRGVMVQLDHGGSVSNLGSILAQRGNVTLAGLAVNQGGTVSATTSVAANGSIYFVGGERPPTDALGNAGGPARAGGVTFGPGSRTVVLPELASGQTSTDAQVFSPSEIVATGRTILAEPGAAIVAPGGIVNLLASDPNGGGTGRIYLGAGSTIDVSGTRDVSIAMARNFVDVQLNSAELADSPLQKGGFLQGKTVTVDVRQGTPVANISGAVAQIGRTAAERTAAGGKVSLVSDGDVILRAGSRVDVSGGTLDYASGVASPTRLIDLSGRIIDIGSAGASDVYIGIVNSGAAGAAIPGTYYPGYVEGKNAGSIVIQAPAAVLDGQLLGGVTRGVYQRAPASLPVAGTLTIGYPGAGGEPPDFGVADIVVANGVPTLPATFDAASAIPAARSASVLVSASSLSSGGFGNLSFGSNGTISVQPGVDLTLGAYGNVSFDAAHIDIAGSLRAPGGRIALRTANTLGGSGGDIRLATGGVLSVAGLWVNDRPGLVDLRVPEAIDGGRVTLSAAGGIFLDAGSAIDVSAGARLPANAAPVTGRPGAIDLSTNRGIPVGRPAASPLLLGGTLSGFGFDAGGSLSLAAGSIVLGGAATTPGSLALDSQFLSSQGFQNFALTGIEGVSVVSMLAPSLSNYALSTRALATPSAGDAAPVVNIVSLPAYARSPIGISLIATDGYLGNLAISKDAGIAVDPGGSIALTAGRQMTIDGTLAAPGGRISLSMAGDPTNPDNDLGFLAGQSIWIGSSGRLTAAGVGQIYLDPLGLRAGRVFPGGEVDVVANKGYVVLAPGATIDVSGAAGTLDIGGAGRAAVARVPTLVASDAGSIDLQSREGLLLGGTLSARTDSPKAAGGQLTLALETVGSNPIGASYPSGPRTIEIGPASQPFPAGLRPGDAIDVAKYNGHAAIGANVLDAFDSVTLRAADQIRFDGNATVTARRSITMDSPVLAGAQGATLKLDTAYLTLGNDDARYQQVRASATGDATLQARAGTIDIVGQSSTTGIRAVTLRADGDIRLQGVLTTDPTVTTLSGGLSTGADLTLSAVQVYPTTLTQFSIDVGGGRPGTFRLSGGGPGQAPLSAAGSLTVTAADIDIEGTLRAPFGRLALDASASLTLGAGSLVSVSGDGLIVPFGQTLNQSQWTYNLGNGYAASIVAPPSKAIALDGPQVTIAKGARVDVSGGGDLRAWEFVPGNGGSTDLLAKPGVFAILPGLRQSVAPLDWQNDAGTALKPGDAVYLSGMPGLAAGMYTLLPAHYALLPGAYAVSTVAGTLDMTARQNYPLSDGSWILSGYRSVAGTPIADSRTQGYLIMSGNLVRRATQYADSSVDTLFSRAAKNSGAALPNLDADAGRLIVGATGSLLLDGDFSFTATGGRGGEADISAPSIEVVSTLHAPDGALQIAADALTALGAQTLLLGGQRSGGPGGVASVGASSVTIANDARHPLRAADVILVANGTVDVVAGGTVDARSTATVEPDPVSVAGNAAVLRVSAGQPAAPLRGTAGPAAPPASVRVGQGATLVADGAIQLDSPGDNAIDRSATLLAPSIAIAAGAMSMGQVPNGTPGLAVDDALLSQVSRANALTLRSYGGITFFGDVTLGGSGRALQHLTLDTASLAGMGGGTVAISAGTIALANSGDTAPIAVGPGTGTLEISATQGNVAIGAGNKGLSGFALATVNATGEVRLAGTGSLAASGDLAFSTARVTADAAALQAITAAGTLAVASNGSSTAGLAAAGVGATLSVNAARIEQSGRIELPAGGLLLTANGASVGDGVRFSGGSVTSVAGVGLEFHGETAYAPGGTITVSSRNGGVSIGAGARLDFSGATGGGDGGALHVSAINGAFSVQGTLAGTSAAGGTGAAVTIDAGRLDGMSSLAATLAAGGARGAYDLRTRGGDIVVAAGDAIKASSIALSADAGRIDIAGSLTAVGGDAGSIALSAGTGLSVDAGAVLTAQGTSARGGRVTLGTSSGSVSVSPGSAIDVSAPDGRGPGGTLRLRAPQNGNDVGIDAVAGAVTGAASIVIEGVRSYTGISRIDTTAGAGTLTEAQAGSDAVAWLANAPAVAARLGLDHDPRVSVIPGIEVRSAGDLTLAADWNLAAGASTVAAGTLTLRSAGNLILNGNLSDGFSSASISAVPITANGWSYRLVGGADLSGADPLAVAGSSAGAGVRLAEGKLIRTGTGSISVASGGDVTLATGTSAIYTSGNATATLGGYSAPIGAYFAGGGGDVSIAALGSIETLAKPSTQLVNDWLLRQGALPVAVSVTGAADTPYAIHPVWGVSFAAFAQGIGALGGGHVSLRAGDSIVNVSAVVPTSGTVSSTTPARSVPLEIGGGDLSLSAGNDIVGGVYFLGNGRGTVRAGGRLRPANPDTPAPLLALGNATFDVSAGRGITVGGIFDPTMLPQGKANIASSFADPRLSFDFTYGPGSAVRLLSIGGGVTLDSDPALIARNDSGGLRLPAGTSWQGGFSVLPGTLEAVALNGDVHIAGTQSLVLYPSATGELRLLADGNVTFSQPIAMSDLNPSILPGVTTPVVQRPAATGGWYGIGAHAATPLHADDTVPVEIVAVNGDVTGEPQLPSVYLPKAATIYAGGDIRNLWVYGQNLAVGDVTTLEAGHDVVFSAPLNSQGQLATNLAGVYWGGPGTVEVLAGHTVDLGSGAGLVSRGNLDNPALPGTGADVLLAAGLGRRADGALALPASASFVDRALSAGAPDADATRKALTDFLAGQGVDRSAGGDPLAAFHALSPERQLAFASEVLFSVLAKTGESATARAGFQRGYDAIGQLFPGTSYTGDVLMYLSQIVTQRGGNITLLVPGGMVNEGLAVPPAGLSKDPSKLGIVTVEGGNVNGFSKGDFQVSQSRVFTLRGGDIVIWSSDGSIDAGKGAKTASYAPVPTVVTAADGSVVVDYNAAASGSGVGVLLTDPTIAPGKVDLIAPRGFVDAGEAGIRSAGDIHIAAPVVLNVANIEAKGQVTGVPIDVPVLSAAAAATLGQVAAAASRGPESIPGAAATGPSADAPRPFSFITVEVLDPNEAP
jgi:filamentous hemagglutinin